MTLDATAGAQPSEAPVTGQTTDPAATPPPADNAGSRESMVALAQKLLDAGDEKDTGGEAEAKRAANGQFAKADGDAEPKTDDAAQPEGEKADEPEQKEPPKPAREAPPQWRLSDTLKAKWAEAPAEVQDAIAQAAARDRTTISRQGNRLAQFEPFGQVLNAHADAFKEMGVPPAQVFNNMMSWHRALMRDPETIVPQFLKAYGVDLAQLTGQTPAADPTGLPPDPEVVQLRQLTKQLADRIENLQRQTGQVASHLTAQQEAEYRRQEQAETQKLGSIADDIKKFAADRPDFQTLVDSGDLEIEIDVLRARGVPEDQLLQKAYDRAVHANAATREAQQKRQQADAEKTRAQVAKKAADAAKRAGTINVRGAPENTAPPANVRDAQFEVLRKHGMLQ